MLQIHPTISPVLRLRTDILPGLNNMYPSASDTFVQKRLHAIQKLICAPLLLVFDGEYPFCPNRESKKP